MNIDFNTESFAFLNSFRLRRLKLSNAGITALALPDRTSNSSSYLSTIVNATPRYFNFSIYFNATSRTCREHCTRFLKKWSTLVLEELILISAMSHAAAYIHLMRIGDQIHRKPAKLIHQ